MPVRLVTVIVAAFIPLASPAPGVAQSAPFHRIHVVVVDEAGQPVRGARVQMRDAGRLDLVQTHTTTAAGDVQPFIRRAGSEIEILPRLDGHFFEPPLAHVVVDGDLTLKFVARPGEAPPVDAADPQPWPARPPKGPDDPQDASGPPKGPVGAAGEMAVIMGQVTWAFTNPDGTVNDIALEGALLFFDRTDVQELRDDRPRRTTDENGEFEPFEVPPGSEYDVEIFKRGYEFDPPWRSVIVEDAVVFLSFTGRAVDVHVGAIDADALERVGSPPDAAPVAGAVPLEPTIVGFDPGPAAIAVQVTVREPGRGGTVREVGADQAMVRYRNTVTGRRGWRRAAGGIAPPYNTTLGTTFEITAEKAGYRFPTERVLINLPETFVPIVGEPLPDTSCSIAGSVNDESGRRLRRWLAVSVYDEAGSYIRGKDAPLNEHNSGYYVGPMEAGVYVVRVTPMRGDPLFVSEPREIRIDCRGSMIGQHFTIR